MNWGPDSGIPDSSSDAMEIANGSVSAATEATSDLFPGDTGELAFETRRVLRLLAFNSKALQPN